MCSYFVVNTENRKVLFGPFNSKPEADAKHYDVCANGIMDHESGVAVRPRCAVVNEHALAPSDTGNHYCHVEPAKKEKNSVAT